MLNQVQEIKVTFKSGDQLILRLKENVFAGHKPVLLWELFYAEKIEDSSDSQNKESAESHFNVVQTEYFPASMIDTATVAFNKRMSCSNPSQESDMGFSLNYLIK